MMRATGRPTFVGGNLGEPLAEAVGTPAAAAGGVVRRRGVQLPARDASRRFRPRVAVLLNITADHLDRYPDMRRLRGRQGAHLRRADRRPTSRWSTWTIRVGVARQRRRRAAAGIGFSVDARARRGRRLRRRATRWSLRLPRRATPSATRRTCPALVGRAQPGQRAGGAAGEPARRRDARRRRGAALRAFRPLAHRMELVAERRGVAYYDDSKGTNVGAVVAALDGFPRPVVLIAGGRDKGGDYAPLADGARRASAAPRCSSARRPTDRRPRSRACCPSSAPRRWTTPWRRAARARPAGRRGRAVARLLELRHVPGLRAPRARCSARPSRASPREEGAS